MDPSNDFEPTNNVNTTTTTTTVTETIPVKESKGKNAEKPLKPPKLRGSCFLYFVMILVRMFCLIAGIAELGYGGWLFYTTKNYSAKVPLDAGLNALAGFFCTLAGLTIIFAELRTRWTTTRAIKVIVFLGSWLGRGLFYLGVALLNLPIKTHVWTFVWFDGRIFAGLLGVAGILSILMHPFFWHLERRREQARQTWIAEQLIAGVELDSIVIDPTYNNTGRTMYDTKLSKFQEPEHPQAAQA